jgi:hypothetical protein
MLANPDLSNASYALSMKSQYSSGNKYDAAGAFMPINPNLFDVIRGGHAEPEHLCLSKPNQ